MFRMGADGGPAELLWDDERPIFEGFLSRDRRLVYRVGDHDRVFGAIYAIRPDADTVGTALVVTEFWDRAATLSPNGRWLAYVSNELGRDEVYVVSFPNAADTKRLVSTAGGSEPVWAHSGKELFYRNGDDLVAVDVTVQPTFAAGQQRVLFSIAGVSRSPFHALYDISPDDQRFVMLRRVQAEQGELIWVDNWFEELKAKVGN